MIMFDLFCLYSIFLKFTATQINFPECLVRYRYLRLPVLEPNIICATDSLSSATPVLNPLVGSRTQGVETFLK